MEWWNERLSDRETERLSEEVRLSVLRCLCVRVLYIISKRQEG